MIRDGEGDLYGTTSSGGGGVGTLYRLDAAGNFTVLFRFAGVDLSSPLAGVVRDAAGNLYGTTSGGGLMNCSFTGCGVVYELDLSGHYTLLHSFTGGLDRSFPGANGILEQAGSLYGITGDGGEAGAGVLYKLALE
ncbi:MAG: choice-of-anchor tandem repeat GloVer-containing protein [Bryobacteraceae bacterium]